jgi:tetratricopeptide (TPR) repeat protein
MRAMTTAEVQQSLDAALGFHQAGKLPQAESLYRKVLSAHPDHPHALQYLGMIALQSGNPVAAVDLLSQAAGLLPDPADCRCNLGVALASTGRIDDAIAAYRRALALRPQFPEALVNLAGALQQSGRPDQAIECCRQAIAVRPDYPEAHNNLGNALRDTARPSDAIAAYRQAVALRPAYPEAWNNLGNALTEADSYDEAILACQKAIALRPTFPEALNNLAIALKKKGWLDEAVAACRRAIALQPALADVWVNLGNLLQRQGYIEESLAAYRRAISLRPDLAIAHVYRGFVLLLKGDFPEGWREFEWRWHTNEFRNRQRDFAQPCWDGSELHGKRILVHAEGGLGDAIQFVRYLPEIARRGGRVVLEATSQLRRLLADMPDISEFVATGEPLPQFDVHCPMMSLPRILDTRLATIPAQSPYLRPDPSLARAWNQRLSPGIEGLKVGLVWAGRAIPDPGRSIPLEMLAPLGQVPRTWFCSLQRYESSGKTPAPLSGLRFTDWTAELGDLTDTAALISCLDLVITVDTAVAHLAGAMGKRVWVLLQFAPDWRWLLDREDCPWYPTMRLFRQPRTGDWESAVRDVACELEILAASSPHTPATP